MHRLHVGLTGLSLATVLLSTACGAGFDLNAFGNRQGLGEGAEVGAGDAEEADDDGEGGDDGDGGEQGDDSGDDGEVGGDDGDFDRDDCKLEDAAIGRTDVTIAFANSTVRVRSWTEKGDSPGEYVGFELEVTGDPLVFTVKAGGESYDGEGGSWAHPNGTSGADVSAISHIDFCENGTPVDGDDEGDDSAGGADSADDGTDGCTGEVCA